MNKLSSKTRTFSHETLHGALAALKSELGDDALIIHTRQVQKKGFLGKKGKPLFEIQACPASSDDSAKPPTNPLMNKTYGSHLNRRVPTALSGSANASRQNRDFEKLSADIESMKKMLQEIALRSREKDDLAGLTQELQELYTHLVQYGVDESCARNLIKKLNHDLTGQDLCNPRRLREALRQSLVEKLPIAPPLVPVSGKPRIALFVGPTGVGKTTTISKLAGYFHHYQQLDVALVTVDTYRIAATEQLHRVAEIVDVPIRVETSPDSLKRALQEFSDKDIILIDTAGRSQRDKLQMNELKKFIEASGADEIFLLLSASQDVYTLEQVIKEFGSMATNLVLSKLDETVRLGHLLNLLLKSKLPLTYWTFGQSIPDDVAAIQATSLVRILLGEESL